MPASQTFPQDTWQSRDAGELGFDKSALDAVIALAQQSETKWPRSMELALKNDPDNNELPPLSDVIGPTQDRATQNGVVIRAGQLAAKWGDTTRADMTFSATKSYLALLTGIAVSDGLIKSIDDRCASTALDDGFKSAQNAEITWRHLLQQTSEWEGTLWGKPDLVDRHRQLGPGADNSRKGQHRALVQAGTFWEYNDVRVNRLSLSLLQLFKRPLENVLRERIMQPIGASGDWQWHAYENAWTEIDGTSLPSVPGGAHWGGGLFISSEDHARVGWLVRNRGNWRGEQLIDSDWFDSMLEPCPLNPLYGCFFWLNTASGLYPSLPDDACLMLGAGQNIIWIDPTNDLVCVLRWIDGERVEQVLQALIASLK